MATDAMDKPSLKKPALAGVLDGGADEPDGNEPDADTDDPKVLAASAVREAISSGSDEDLAAALDGFFKLKG